MGVVSPASEKMALRKSTQTDTGHVSINVRDQVFSCDWSARRGGRGAIDLAMLVRGLDFKDAIAWLKTIDPDRRFECCP